MRDMLFTSVQIPNERQQEICLTLHVRRDDRATVKILKFGTPQTIAIIVLEIEKFDVTLH